MLHVQKNEWALLDEKGGTAIVFDSLMDMRATEEAEAPDSPVEEGAFASYNKISRPSAYSVTLAFQGDTREQDAMLRKLGELKEGTRLLKLSTPARFYDSLTLTRFEYSRSAGKGAQLLSVSMKLKEVREVQTHVSTTAIPRAKAKNRASADREDRGQARSEKLEGLASLASDVKDLLFGTK